MNEIGASSMEIVTTSTRNAALPPTRMPSVCVAVNNTEANSPPCVGNTPNTLRFFARLSWSTLLP
jgi:hypothetical protein